MITISFNAFSSLGPKLAAAGKGFVNERIEVANGTTVLELIARCGLPEDEVDAVFLNGRIVPWNRELRDGDRVALVPPGTPGPYRVLLGLRGPSQPRHPSRTRNEGTPGSGRDE
ncbi:MAG: MoaD/ThiS family protein [bacterium]|nr:MoaD/ThiS family protein [bacterium]